MGLYEPIANFLRQTRESRIRLTFKEVERILSRPLPQSAYRHREWWANNPSGHSHARSWTEAGWRTEKVDLEKRVLFFARERSGAATASAFGVEAIPDPFGAMRGSVTFSPGVDLTVPTGEQWEAEQSSRE